MVVANKKKGVLSQDGIGFLPRIFHRTFKRKSPRYTIKCGCCDESLEIYYSDDDLEINGVYASKKHWRDILLPLLK